MERRPTQRDIAEHATVSQTTVSLVLSGKGRQFGITDDTEHRILETARRLGYAPNVTAQALRTGRNNLIAVHTFEPLFPTQADHYYYEFMVGIEQQATRSGQDLVLLTSVHRRGDGASLHAENPNRLHLADGAVILGFNENDRELEELARQGFPFVFIGRRERAAKLMPYVVGDYLSGASTIARLLVDLGHTRIGYLGSTSRHGPAQERLSGIADTLNGVGTPMLEPRLVDDATPIDPSVIEGLLREGATVLVMESALRIAELDRVCTALDIDIPDQLGVVSLDALGPDTTRDWTRMMTPRQALGERAVDILLRLIDGRCSREYSEEISCGIDHGRTVLPVTRMTPLDRR